MERHFVAMRSRRQQSVLTFLAQDVDGRAFCYSNADLRKGEEAEEIFQAGVAPQNAAMGLPDYRASLANDDTSRAARYVPSVRTQRANSARLTSARPQFRSSRETAMSA